VLDVQHAPPDVAAAAAVVKGSMSARCMDMQRNALWGIISTRSNKDACSMEAQWHAARMSMHNSVAGLPVASEVFKHAQ